MKLSVEMAVMELDGEWNAVAVGEDSSKFHGMLRLNESAADIIKLLAEETTPEKMLADMRKIYPDTPSRRGDLGSRCRYGKAAPAKSAEHDGQDGGHRDAQTRGFGDMRQGDRLFGNMN